MMVGGPRTEQEKISDVTALSIEFPKSGVRRVRLSGTLLCMPAARAIHNLALVGFMGCGKSTVGRQVAIDMTMTSPACPAGPQLIADTKRAVGSHRDVGDVEVRIVMEPPWTPDRMTDAARDQLGIF